MPKILVTPAKGLFQESGSGTFSGHLNEVKTLTGASTLTQADSGKIILLGGDAGTVQFPVTAGWHAEFLLTGSLAGAVVVSGSVSSAGTVTVQGRELGDDGSTDAVAIASGVGATFANSTAAAGDGVKVRVLTSGLIQMETKTST